MAPFTAHSIAESRQVVEQRDGVVVVGGTGIGLGAVGIDAVEQRGQGDLDGG